ncbi:MAG TPA: SGNH/GDSL hydrolase family protein [Marmoricola sp.]|nr:SGNH/GDSL hydrolase family protein [Marmoricola sp.]
MPLRRRARRTGALLVALAALGAAASCGGSDHRDGAEYAALGDSVSAGAGIAPVVDDGCLRSGRNFASLVAERTHYSSFEDVTCSGATTSNLLRPQLTSGATNDPQLDAVGPRTRLVTLSIGLNDDQLTYALLGACLAPSGQASSSCGQVLGASPQVVESTLTAAAGRVRDSLRLIRRSAPKARIVLVGYPRYLPDAGSCPDRYPILPAMEAPLRSAWQEVDQLWKAAAASAGADYVDTYALSEGHDLCSADPWVNGTTDLPGKAAALHPFAAFHEAVADRIVQLLQKR